MQNKPLALPFALLFVGALLGLVFSGVLIYEHNGAKTEIGSAVCNVQNADNCAKAKDSAMGKPFGIPLALVGFFYYGVTAALAVFLLIAFNDTAIRLTLWGALAAILFDFFLLLYSLVVLGGICRLCAITYAASVLVAIGAYLIHRRGEKIMKVETVSNAAKAAFAAVLIFTVGGGLFFNNRAIESKVPEQTSLTREQQQLIEQLNNEFYKQWLAGEKLGIDVPKSGGKGAVHPVLTIAEFADPLCPHCKDMGIVLGDFVKKHADKVRVVFRHYPLDIQCNDAMKRAFHVGACDLARTIECGEAQGKFWQMHDAVFAQQETFFRNPVTEKSIEAMAQAVGANATMLLQCFRGNATMTKVKADIAAGNRIKIQGTPTVIVNDRKLPSVPLEYIPGVLTKILAEESKRAP
ncbi:MAG: thioredoxin domain-containing protein [Spirochaetes bacterium]|nr:thioredoxin domain-containing protein [Spirochaetota bacterium]